MLSNNHLQNKLTKGQQSLGTWNIINSPMLVDVIASTDIDFIIVDAEHGSFSYETAQTLVSICQSHNVSPIMRVGEVNETLILRALDIGMHGVQLPNIRTPKDAKRFVEYAKYPPQGNRGFSPYTKAGLYDVNNAQLMPKVANDNTLLIVNIEDEEGLNNLGDIASVEGIDVIFIGLFDLSKALGCAGDIQNQLVLSQLNKAIEIVHKHKKKVGSIASTPTMLSTLKDMKVDYITYSVDTGMVRDAYQKIIKKFTD